MEPRLLRLGQAWCLLSVFIIGSVVPEAPWGLEASGGFEACGFLIVKQECSRTCCGRLTGKRLMGVRWSSMIWG